MAKHTMHSNHPYEIQVHCRTCSSISFRVDEYRNGEIFEPALKCSEDQGDNFSHFCLIYNHWVTMDKDELNSLLVMKELTDEQ